MTTKHLTPSTYEKGYKPVLVREETKQQLRDLRAALPDRDLFQERRLATAALELVIDEAVDSEFARERLLQKARDVVKRDLEASDPRKQ